MAVGSVCTFYTTLVSTFDSNWNQPMGSVVAVGSVCTFYTTLVSTFDSNWNQPMGICSGSRISMYILYNLGKYILQEQELVYVGLYWQ